MVDYQKGQNMSRTVKDIAKKGRKTALQPRRGRYIVKAIQTTGQAPKRSYRPSNDELAIRRMDPAFKEWWDSHDEQFDRSDGLDWWLEFGFPKWLGIFTEVVLQIKLRKVLCQWIF
jgi:hypothetical protein